jgi:regulator of sigma E protease
MLDSLRGTLAFVVLLGVLVFVHELGHFVAAKLNGVKVLRFAFGFGPRLFGFRKGETDYCVCLLPLGGYVLMAGAQGPEELPPEEEHRSLLAKSPWQRAVISAAGPLFSLAFPILVYFAVYVGSHQELSSRVASVDPGLPAAAAGLQPGDRITALDGRPVRSFADLQETLMDAAGRPMAVHYERDGKPAVAQVTPAPVTEGAEAGGLSRGIIGVGYLPRAAAVGVPAGSPAAAAGLRTFDRITAVNGQPVADEPALQRALAALAPGAPLTLGVERPAPETRRPLPPLKKGEKPPEPPAPETRTVTLTRQEGAGYAALGAEPTDFYVGFVAPDSPAARAGLGEGDRLVAMDGAPLVSQSLLLSALHQRKDQPFRLSWRPAGGGEVREGSLAQAATERKNAFGHKVTAYDHGARLMPTLDADSEPEQVAVTYTLGEALAKAFEVVPNVIAQTSMSIGTLLTGGGSLKDLGGPVLIYQVASKTAEYGLDPFLRLMAVISVNLGLVNLFPIPIFDGFAILLALWEGVRRRPVTLRARELANYVGLVFVIALFIMVMFNDIRR